MGLKNNLNELNNTVRGERSEKFSQEYFLFSLSSLL
jgi:hypothetical protein